MIRKWFYTGLAILAIAIYLLAMAKYIPQEKYIILAIPFAMLSILWAILKSDKVLLMIVFLAPLSVPLREYFPDLSIDMYLPTEPFLILLTFLFILKLIFQKESINKNLLTHPVSLTIYFSLFWILITSLSSSIPTVSFKFLASRLWLLIPFYFMASILFLGDRRNIRRFISLYTFSLIIVVFYTINKHLSYGLNDQEASNWVCSPFFNDHTSYGAALAMILFALIPFLNLSNYGKKIRTFAYISLALILFGLVFSYTRAAWLSVIGALGVLVLVLLKIKLKYVLISLFLVVGTTAFLYSDIMNALEKNEQDSSGNFSQHITSIANITTDASNVERLNRWNSAIRMFKERPIFGWGPGTYTFQYAPYQYSREKTIISTNFGDGGNAHSEYLGPLAESGVIGSLYFLLIGIVSLVTGFRVYKRSKEKEIKWLALFITLGLTTYLLHAFLNNFLDTDKLSALFWGFIAILVSLDIQMKKTSELNTQ